MAAISKEEYLKRYLSIADAGDKKKRKKKIKTGVKTGKSLIIDDDVNLSDIKVRSGTEYENLLELADENPLIFNETGSTVLSKDLESIKKKEEEKKAMWAPVRNIQDEIPSEIRDQTQVNSGDLTPKRDKVKKVRHDSSSPERSNINNQEQAKIDRIKTGKPKQQRLNSVDISPPRHYRHDSSSDQSPIRQAQPDVRDLLPQRRRANVRQGSPTDQSPVRRTRHDSSSDQSPSISRQPSTTVSKEGRHDSPDLSPLRKMGHNRSSNQSSPRGRRPAEKISRRARHDFPDLSPPRRNVDRLTSCDQSPPRRRQTVNNKNQILNRRRHDTPDLSPSRTSVSSPDQSPPRMQSEQAERRPVKDEHDDDGSDQSPPRKKKNTERKAGLHSAAELRQENEKTRQRENEIFARMSSSTTGKGAETIHRDKTGRKRDFKVEEVKKREEERKKQEENEKFMEWGKGVQQSKAAKNQVHDDLYEMSKPLARYQDDRDLDLMLKERDRDGDPMLAFVQKKKAKENRVAGKKEKPRYKGPAPPPNRFNIPPGYRWDGVDRSNGFEKKRFSMLSNKGATREEAYKWSTEDM